MWRAILAFTLCWPGQSLLAQRSRINGAIENARRHTLEGHLSPRTETGTDLGRLDDAEVLPSVTLLLRQTASQQADLEKLLAEQQDPSSANYHHWLSPEEYAERFGVSSEDIGKLSAWLEQQNLHVTAVGKARNWISFRGTARDVGQAFGTELRRYQVNGQRHFANATEPSIPEALVSAVRSIRGLNDFHLKPQTVRRRTSGSTAVAPQYTSSSGNHYLSPEDVATIYNLKPLHSAGITGAGQKIVVAGQTQVNVSDLQQFRTRFNLPANDPDMILVPNTRDPGVISDDLGEADLDLEWAGAAAPNAKIIYVYSYDVMDAVQYAIDQNLAPVLSLSYGLCETQTPRSDLLAMQASARQANAQGMTWINASGDSGGADCVYGSSTAGAGFAVDAPASIPEVTGIGGTTLNEGAGNYWNTTNTANGGSALSYIPEVVWNDSAPRDPAAGGGGASAFFAKPSWQTGPGVPADGARDVPDISLAASAEHDGYIVYNEGQTAVFGGTSAGAPVFAGILTLLNQYLVLNGVQAQPGLGNVNPRLYSLAHTAPGAFHDVTSGDNIVTVTCGSRSRNCVSGSYGYPAGPGYDQATGLGSVDAYNLVLSWRGSSGAVNRSMTSLLLTASAATVLPAETATLTATVKSVDGGTPQGSVTFYLGAVALGTAPLNGFGGTAVATLRVSGAQLAAGTNTITAQYNGDTSYTGAVSSVSLSVTGAVSGAPSITSAANGASFQQRFAPGMLVSIFGAQLAGATLAAASVPLPRQLASVSATVNGISAPLFYVSPGQVNVQIPYEVSANSTAVLNVTNNGQTASTSMPISAAAPGIFADANGRLVPSQTAVRGQVITLYVTGAGALSPSVATGSAPASSTPVANLPKPLQSSRVTIGGVQAPVQFIGNPSGLVGVVQINCQVPAATPTGTQSVFVTIGGVSSTPAAVVVSK